MKTGILYARSDAHPGLMVDFVEGIKTALQYKQLDGEIQLFTESIGFGGNEKEVYEKAEKLLLLEGVDVLIAFVDLRALEKCKPLVISSGKLLLAVNPGANYPQDWATPPNILHLTLQHAFLCWLTGKLAAAAGIKNAVMATTFYDCGYLHTAAMVAGFVKEGGNITYNYVNNQRYDDTFEIEPLTGYLSSDKTTTGLLCIFDSVPASLFYSRLDAYDGAGSLHLFVSPMMLEQQALENLANGFNFSVDGYLPWHPSVQNKANRDFMNFYLQQTKRAASVFSLLGWETGLVLQEVFLHGQGQYADGAAIAGKLAGLTIGSPRGNMKLDPRTNYFIAQVCKYSISQQAGQAPLEYIENTGNEWAGFVQLRSEGVSSGWTNTYGCY